MMAPIRRIGQGPALIIEAAPAYEFLMSLATVTNDEQIDTVEIGPEWVQDARRRAGPELLERVNAVAHGEPDGWVHLVGLAFSSPAPHDVANFIDHLRGTDADEIRLHLVDFYDRETRSLTPPDVIRKAVAGDPDAIRAFLRSCHPDIEAWQTYLKGVLDDEPEAFKAELISVLEAWAESVFAVEEPAIMPILLRDVEAKRELARTLPLDDFIKTATNGVEFGPRPGLERVALVANYVNRPLVSHVEVGESLVVLYPVADESVSAETDAPPLRLVRLAKALADDKRLRILRALADGEKTLMELAELFGVPKTTMHHHMIVLRSAGLVAVALGTKRYRLREETVPDLDELLSGYLSAPPAPPAGKRKAASS
jgi:DNA-binding transcriptional ArsR family regulator